LQSVALRGCEIGDEGARHLATSLAKSVLTELNVNSNNIGNEGTICIADVLSGSKLKMLNLGRNEIGNDGAVRLGLGLQGSNVVKINLFHNKIGDVGAVAFAKCFDNKSSQVKDVNLGNNEIYDIGAIGLAHHLTNDSSLTILKLDGNKKIGVPGAISLYDKVVHRKTTLLTSLKLDPNKESDQAQKDLLDAFVSMNFKNNEMCGKQVAASTHVTVQDEVMSTDTGAGVGPEGGEPEEEGEEGAGLPPFSEEAGFHLSDEEFLFICEQLDNNKKKALSSKAPPAAKKKAAVAARPAACCQIV
jgi:hypothetical protein